MTIKERLADEDYTVVGVSNSFKEGEKPLDDYTYKIVLVCPKDENLIVLKYNQLEKEGSIKFKSVKFWGNISRDYYYIHNSQPDMKYEMGQLSLSTYFAGLVQNKGTKNYEDMAEETVEVIKKLNTVEKTGKEFKSAYNNIHWVADGDKLTYRIAFSTTNVGMIVVKLFPVPYDGFTKNGFTYKYDETDLEVMAGEWNMVPREVDRELEALYDATGLNYGTLSVDSIGEIREGYDFDSGEINKIFVSGHPSSGKSTLIEGYKDNDSVYAIDMDTHGSWNDDKTAFNVNTSTLLDDVAAAEDYFKAVGTDSKLILVAGIADNLSEVVEKLEDDGFVTVWLKQTKKTLKSRLSARVKTADENNFWHKFKGKIADIDKLSFMKDLNIHKELFSSNNLMTYPSIVNLIDAAITTDEDLDTAKVEQEKEKVAFVEETKPMFMSHARAKVSFYIDTNRAVVVIEPIVTTGYVIWTVQGGEDHRIVVSGKDPFDETLNMNSNPSYTWVSNRVSESFFLDKVGYDIKELHRLWGLYSMKWCKITTKLQIPLQKEK